MVKVGDIVTLRKTSPEIVSRSNGAILRYVGHSAGVFRVVEEGLMAIEFRDGMTLWVSMAMITA